MSWCPNFCRHLTIRNKMKKLVVANWKMNPKTADESRKLVASWEHGLRRISDQTEVIVAAPFVYLPGLSNYVSRIKLAAQNASWQDQGPLTGEISASQLKQYHVSHVILGHSERRLYLGETDSMINAKLMAVLKQKLTPIVCLGGEDGVIKTEMKNLITKQFIRLTKDLDKKQLEKMVYVYEPVWAISTMKNSEPETGPHAAEMVAHIYDLLEKKV